MATTIAAARHALRVVEQGRDGLVGTPVPAKWSNNLALAKAHARAVANEQTGLAARLEEYAKKC